MAQVFDANKEYQIKEDEKNGKRFIRREGNNYPRLQSFLDDFVVQNNVKPEKLIRLSKEELFRELEVQGSYDRYQACRGLASHIEKKLTGYVVMFRQIDWKYHWDFILLEEHYKALQKNRVKKG